MDASAVAISTSSVSFLRLVAVLALMLAAVSLPHFVTVPADQQTSLVFAGP